MTHFNTSDLMFLSCFQVDSVFLPVLALAQGSRHDIFLSTESIETKFFLWDSKFPQLRISNLISSGTWHLIVYWIDINISKEFAVSIFKVLKKNWKKKQVECKEFWRWYVTLRFAGFMDSVQNWPYDWIQWMRLALSKGPEDDNRSSFRNVGFLSI
jgi:hypothetical protein